MVVVRERVAGRARIWQVAVGLIAVGVLAALLVTGWGWNNTGAGSAAHLAYAAPRYDDWPYFGRDRDGTRYATQTQINASNVHDLGVAWSTSLGPNQFLVEGYPVEVGGTLYVTTSSDEVQAYSATSGRLEWQYAPHVDFSQSTGVGGYGVTTNRGVAYDDGMLFELTFDDHLEAISQATGEELWSSPVADDATGAYETMAPTV
jgi:quinohemoprotein ethanol dehydrogenase